MLVGIDSRQKHCEKESSDLQTCLKDNKSDVYKCNTLIQAYSSCAATAVVQSQVICFVFSLFNMQLRWCCATTDCTRSWILFTSDHVSWELTVRFIFNVLLFYFYRNDRTRRDFNFQRLINSIHRNIFNEWRMHSSHHISVMHTHYQK